ncbi:MAG: ISL3 family transposase [Planctomycetes bacterium]|nr:ISL3 family transposase [Planctomycetota bacterium]
MDANQIFSIGLGLESPWHIVTSHLDVNVNPHRLDLRIEAERGALYPCPTCGRACKAHDFKEFTWRHLNFFQHHCYVTAPVPRTDCPEHGVLRANVPWAREGNAFTMFFEAQVLMLAREMPIAALARFVGETDHRLWRIVEHYVQKALTKLDLSATRAVALDETASKRGQNYVTVFIDMERADKPVIFATEGRGKETLARFAEHLEAHGGHAGKIAEVVCDMSGAFLAATGEHFKNAAITVDWFHVVSLFTTALDEVRRTEAHQQTMPKHLRFALLKNSENVTATQQAALAELEQRGLATAQAYRCKETLGWIREAESPQAASWRLTRFVGYFTEQMKAAVLAPMKKALTTMAGMKSLIVQRWHSTYTNARLEGLNGLFQAARARARGYRNVNTFKTMIYLIGAPLGEILNQLTKPFCPANSI